MLAVYNIVLHILIPLINGFVVICLAILLYLYVIAEFNTARALMKCNAMFNIYLHI